MTRVAFLGLGAMGTPMAWNCYDAGFDLHVYNRSPDRMAPFEEEDVVTHRTARSAARDADVVVVMVTDGDAVHDVMVGDDGLLAGLAEDAVVVQMSTVGVDETTTAATHVEAAGGRFVDAPVSGTVGPAEQGTLTVLTGGDAADVDEVRPVLEAMGDPVVHCGDVGDGTRMKLVVNQLLGVMMEGFAEAVTFGRAQGLDYDTMLRVIESGGMDAPLFRAKGAAIREGDFDPRFTVDLLFKDLSLALSTAGDVETSLPATAATREAVNAARGLGHGGEDMAAVVKYLETVADVPVAGGSEEGET